MSANNLPANSIIQLPENIVDSCSRISDLTLIYNNEILLTRANITKDVLVSWLKFNGNAKYWCEDINVISGLVADAEKYSTADSAGDQARHNLRCALHKFDEQVCSFEIGLSINREHYREAVNTLAELHKSKAENAQAYIEKLEAFTQAISLYLDHGVKTLDNTDTYYYQLYNIIQASQNHSSNPDNYPHTSVITPSPVIVPPLVCENNPTKNPIIECSIPAAYSPLQDQTVNSIAIYNSDIALRIAAGLSGTVLLIGVIALTFKPTLFNPIIRQAKSLFDNITSGRFGLFSQPQIDYAYAPMPTENSERRSRLN
jgi:tetratricopeptide (TPR) repeat protein